MNGCSDHTRDDVAIEAAEWYARLRAPVVSDLEAARFRAWLAADPAHRREFEAIDALWEDLHVVERSPAVRRIRREISRHRRNRRFGRFSRSAAGARGLGIATAMLILVAGSALLWQQWQWDRYVTEVGELRTLLLDDGSVIALNTASEVKLRFSNEERRVELLRGQANFEVAKDPDRPFVVSAGGGEVRAVGTNFDVYEAPDKVIVTLIEGRVAVTPSGSSASSMAEKSSGSERAVFAQGEPGSRATSSAVSYTGIVLTAGERLSFNNESGSVERTTVDLSRASAWRNRKLNFSDTPLLEAIAEANRYSREKIVLKAPELRGARISGIFEAGRNDLFAEGLRTYFHLNVQRTEDRRIILTSQR